MKHALKQGILFSRWMPDLAFGYGFPFFNYRAPLSYYMTLGLHVTGLSLPWALNLVYVVSILGSALGAYLLVRDLLGPYAGLVGAVAYAYAPYQLLDAFVRGNAPEAVALGLMPFILWAFRRLALVGGRRWFVASIALLTLLYLGHNISSLLFTPFLLAYMLVLWGVYRAAGHWRHVGAAFLLALGLTVFFWFPALAEKEHVQLYLTSATRTNDFHYNFVSLSEIFAPPEAVDTSLMNPPLKIKLGLAQVVSAGLGLSLGLAVSWKRGGGSTGLRPGEGRSGDPAQGVGSNRDAEQLASLLFFAGSAVVFVFMSTSASVWLWEKLPLLPFVQFPWRFVGRASLPVALLAGAALLPLEGSTDRVGKRGRREGSRLRPCCYYSLPLLLVAIIILAALPATYPPRGYCPMTGYPTVEDVHRYERNSGLVGVDPVGAYFPVWVQQRPSGSSLEAEYASGEMVARFDTDALPQEARVLEAEYGPNRARILVDSPRPFHARYLSFYFPGWRVQIDGKSVPISPSDPGGLITFDVPAGRHTIRVRFGETPVRLATDLFSVGCLLLALLYTLRWTGSEGDRPC